MMRSLLFVSLVLSCMLGLTLGAYLPSSNCDGAKSISDCAPDWSYSCSLCANDPNSPACSSAYHPISSGPGVNAQVCGTSTMTSSSSSNETKSMSFCCPKGTWRNETYSCSSKLNTGFGGISFDSNGTLTGDYWECTTASGQQLIDDIVGGLTTLFKLLIAGAVITVVCCIGSIAWCCCVGAWCRSKGYYGRPTAVVMNVASPSHGHYVAPAYHGAPPQGFAAPAPHGGNNGFARFA